jgi:hypothetical protein
MTISTGADAGARSMGAVLSAGGIGVSAESAGARLGAAAHVSGDASVGTEGNPGASEGVSGACAGTSGTYGGAGGCSENAGSAAICTGGGGGGLISSPDGLTKGAVPGTASSGVGRLGAG